MKIGIITYHFAENYGSVLQAYALSHYLDSQDGVSVEVLNYISPEQEANNSLYGHRKGFANILLTCAFLPFHPWRSRKRNRFQSFIKTNIVTSKRVSSMYELEAYVESGSFDVLASGSDQVWNPKIRDYDDAFFYPFRTRAKKVGYAISLGSATSSDVAPYKSYMSDFEAISCREAGAVNQLNKCGLNVDCVVCDPVFLLSGNDWRALSTQSDCDYSDAKPYMACYFLNKENKDQCFSRASKIADEMGLEMKTVNAAYSKHSVKKGTLLDVGPLEFLNLLDNAAFICTDSFHGTAFSILFEKQFLSFDKRLGSTDDRKKDLLEAIGLSDRLQRVEQDFILNQDCISDEEYVRVRSCLDDYIATSIGFINKKIL